MVAEWDIIVVGSGNAALCAAIAAQEAGKTVLILEAADESAAGGNSKYTAGAMRFVYSGKDDLMPLLADRDDPRLPAAEFGAYTSEDFAADLLRFNDGQPLTREQRILIGESYEAVAWMAGKGIRFEPIFSRQSFLRDDRHVFWGGLTLCAEGEGVGLVDAEMEIFASGGGEIRFNAEAIDLLADADGSIIGVRAGVGDGRNEDFYARAVILGCGGFEASLELREKYFGREWTVAKVRGTSYNTGRGIQMALGYGAAKHGRYSGCHATPMDLHTPDYGNTDLPIIERKNYRKICYFLGVMVNANGERFVDEGMDFRNYTYAQFGRSILEQPGQVAWQIFDSKVLDLLYEEYHFHDAHYLEAETLDGLLDRIEGITDKKRLGETLVEYNRAVDEAVSFDPSILDGKSAPGIVPPKSNWAQTIDQGPFRAYPVTGGITFTYGGLKVSDSGAVLRGDGSAIGGLFACGEIVGGVFLNGYPGGSGLTSGAVFGRRAGRGAASHVAERAAAPVHAGLAGRP